MIWEAIRNWAKWENERADCFGCLIMLAGFVLSSIDHNSASATDTSIPDNAATSNLSEANNSSASATITIRMYTVPDK